MRQRAEASSALLGAACMLLILSGCGVESAGSASGNVDPTEGSSAMTTRVEDGDGDCGMRRERAAEGPRADGTPYIGQEVTAATAAAERQGLTVRIVGKDGECFVRTNDLSPRRVNFYVQDGKVAAAEGF